MGIVVRQSIITTIISYIGVIIGYINLLYLFPKFLAPEQLGLLRTVQDAAILFAPFAQFGIAQSIYRYYPRFALDKKTAASFISLMLVLGLLGFLFFFFVFTLFENTVLSYFQENAAEVIQYTSIVLWLTLVLLMTAILEAYSRSALKVIVPNLLREIVVRSLLAILVVLYFQEFLTYHQFIISTVLAYFLCLLILFAYLSLSGQIRLTTNFRILNRAQTFEFIKYSLLSFAGTAGLIIVGKIDSLMVSGLLGLAATAVYTTAFYMATVIEIPKRAISQIVMPLISRAFEKKDLSDVANLYQKTSINQFIIGALLLIGVWANLGNIFSLMPRQEIYEAGKWVVVIVGTGKLIDMVFGPSSEIIVLSKYYWFNIILILLLAATLILANNFLIPTYGINGAAIGAASALLLFNFVKYLFVYNRFKFQPFTFNTGKVLLISLLTVSLNEFLPDIKNVFIDIAYRSTLLTLFYGILVIVLKPSEDSNRLFKSGVTKLSELFKGVK
ncbi:MAG: oligosaccharide flippase family protein [Flammeovirgaceae bacterium]|nr:oligosaccharide flippase family protein [Flammeovirgaceae bacterium]